MNDCDKVKLIFKDVPNSLKVQEMELIFENKRFVGKGDFEVEKLSELNLSETKRDILLEYKSEKSVQALLKIGTIVYHNFKLVPLLFNSCQSTSQKSPVPVIYNIIDIYKYPFYLLTLNEEFLKNFENELKKNGAKIKSIDENNIKIEKILEEADAELEKNCYSDMENCLQKFLKNNFTQLQMKNIDEKEWPQIRNRAVNLCKKSNKINLIYRNSPNNMLRIDGEKELIEKLVNEEYFSNEKIL